MHDSCENDNEVWGGQPSACSIKLSNMAAYQYIDTEPHTSPEAFQRRQFHPFNQASRALIIDRFRCAIFASLQRLLGVLRVYCCAWFSVFPIVGNLIAISLALALQYGIDHMFKAELLLRYHHYFTVIVHGLIAWQLLRSSARSLLLPLLALLIGYTFTQTGIGHHVLQHVLTHSGAEHLIITGIIGVGLAIFFMR